MSRKKARKPVAKVRSNRLLLTFTIGLLALSSFNISVLTLSNDDSAFVQGRWKDAISDIWQDLIPGYLRGCLIKGNINSGGDRIYHTSESTYYSKTTIQTGQGERWFCTIEEAENAGWRAPYEYKGPKGFFG